MYFKWHMHYYDSNLWTFHKEITYYDWKMYMKEKIRFKKITKMTVIDHNSAVQLRSCQFSATVILTIFLNRIFSFIYIFQS